MSGRDPKGWILTYTGRQFWPLDPRPEDVAIEDIAHGLSNACRFAGQCRRFYSVAQHSVLVGRMCWALTEAPAPAAALDGLMHDAAEAYLGDLVRPVKYALDNYRAAEERLQRVILEGLELEWLIPGGSNLTKRMDQRALATERRDLMEHGGRFSLGSALARHGKAFQADDRAVGS